MAAKKRATKRATKRKTARSTGKTKRARTTAKKGSGTKVRRGPSSRKTAGRRTAGRSKPKPGAAARRKKAVPAGRRTARPKAAPKPVASPSKAPAVPPRPAPPPAGGVETLVEVGTVMHFFAIPNAAAIEITAESLAIGDLIRIKGHTTNLRQHVTSMQIEHAPIERARRGDVIGLHVEDRVREQDTVFKVMRPA